MGIGIGAAAGAAVGAGAYYELYELKLGFAYETAGGGSFAANMAGFGSGLNFGISASQAVGAGIAAFGSYSVYNYGLGTPGIGNGWEFDVSAGAYYTGGRGSGPGMPVYGLNYNTRVGTNYYGGSFTIGQFLTYNSATNEMTDQVMLGGRYGDLSFYYHNDHQSFCRIPFSLTDSDQGWTGGGTISYLNNDVLYELAHESFTGKRPINKHWEYRGLNGYRYYKQNYYDESLNKASTIFRCSYYGTTMGNNPWAQNFIHDYMAGVPRFYYH